MKLSLVLLQAAFRTQGHKYRWQEAFLSNYNSIIGREHSITWDSLCTKSLENTQKIQRT